MTARTKDLLYLLAFTVIVAGGAYFLVNKIQQYAQQEDLQASQTSITAHDQETSKTYQSQALGLEFSYPDKLKVTEKDGVVTLNHQVPFENYGDCDMKGDERKYPNLNDFNVKIQVYNGSVAQAAKKMSPYMPSENFSGNTLKVSPGYIDPYQIGNFSGFSIYEGVEGCGHTIYYFPITSNKTLVVTKDMVQILSGIMSSNIKEELLKVPGVIDNDQSNEIFGQILSSLKIQPQASKPGWNTLSASTAYGEKYKFTLEYPSYWTEGESRGGKALTYGQCTIAVGDGGRGMEGYPAPKIETATVDGIKSTVQTWTTSESDTVIVNTQVLKGNGSYIFNLYYPAKQTKCLEDYKGILETVKILGN